MVELAEWLRRQTQNTALAAAGVRLPLVSGVIFFLSKLFPFTLEITIYKCLSNLRVYMGVSIAQLGRRRT